MRGIFFGEFFGTFLMVLCGCGAIKLGFSPLVVSVVFGLAVTLAIISFRSFSGAHINPAVSIAFYLSGHVKFDQLIFYLSGQIFGGWLAAMIIGDYGATTLSVSSQLGIMIEIFITFVLMFSIYCIIRLTDEDIPVAILVGLVVAILAFCFGTYTGASMNPARTFGPNFVSGEIIIMPLYVISTIIGAVLAALLKNQIFASDDA